MNSLIVDTDVNSLNLIVWQRRPISILSYVGQGSANRLVEMIVHGQSTVKIKTL